MNARTLQLTAVAALALGGLAWWTSRPASPKADAAAAGGTFLFPELAKKGNEVAAIAVLSRGKSFRLVKEGDAWGAADKGGYPVNFDKVKDVVGKLAYFKVLEKKTDRPELFDKLELAGAEGEDAKSTRITLSDASGTVLADVLLGKSGGGGPGASSTYVRRPDENQTYEVTGSVYVDGTLTNWLDKQVLKLERARVHSVRTRQADGAMLAISKAAPDDKNFTVLDLPENAELKWPGVADSIGGALEFLNFEDVEARGRIDFNDPKAVSTTMQTFDGLLVDAKVLEVEGKFYAEFAVRADPAARVEVVTFEPPPAAGPPSPTTDGAGQTSEPTVSTDGGEGAAAAPIEKRSVPGKSAEEIAKEAEQWNAKVSKWTYVLPGYAASNLTKKLTDMVKEPEPLPGMVPADPAAPTPPADPADGGDHGGHDDHAPASGGGR